MAEYSLVSDQEREWHRVSLHRTLQDLVFVSHDEYGKIEPLSKLGCSHFARIDHYQWKL